MKISAILSGFGLAAFAQPALAGPAYLQCTIVTEAANVQVDLTMDEQNAQVIIYLPHSGYSRKLTGVFTPSDVKFADRSAAYTVSRTDLSIARYIPIFKETEMGRCELMREVPKRAF